MATIAMLYGGPLDGTEYELNPHMQAPREVRTPGTAAPAFLTAGESKGPPQALPPGPIYIRTAAARRGYDNLIIYTLEGAPWPR